MGMAISELKTGFVRIYLQYSHSDMYQYSNTTYHGQNHYIKFWNLQIVSPSEDVKKISFPEYTI